MSDVRLTIAACIAADVAESIEAQELSEEDARIVRDHVLLYILNPPAFYVADPREGSPL